MIPRQNTPHVKPSDAERLRVLVADDRLSPSTRDVFARWLAALEADPLHGLSSQRLDAVRGAERALGLCDQAGRPQVASPAAQAARAARALGGGSLADAGRSGVAVRELRREARAADAAPTLDNFDANPTSAPAGRYSSTAKTGELPPWLSASPGTSAAGRGLPLRPPGR